MKARQRSVRSDIVTEVERPWIELVHVAGVMAVRDVLLERGIPTSQAAGMAVWLHDQGSRRRHVTGNTAWRYRRSLEEIGPPPSRELRAIPG